MSTLSSPPIQQLPPLGEIIQHVMDRAGNDSLFLETLIDWQCRCVGAVRGGAFITSEDRPPRLASIYPIPADRKVDLSAKDMELLRELASRGREQAKQTIQRADESHHALSTPLVRQGQVEGVTVLLTRSEYEAQMLRQVEKVQTLAGLYEGHVTKRMLIRHQRQIAEARAALSVLRAAQMLHRFEACAMAVCNQVKAELDAWRVSIGWARGDSVRLLAMSDTESIDQRQELTLKITAAMEECFDQQQAIVAPVDHLVESDNWLTQAVLRCHHEMVGPDKRVSVCSAPLRNGDDVVGALTIERMIQRTGVADAVSFDAQSASHVQAIADLVTPRLVDQYEADRPLAVKAASSTAATLAKVIGPRHVGSKLVAAIMLTLIVWSCLATRPYRVAGDLELQAARRRVHSAAFDGFLVEVAVKPGDKVAAGQILGRLDDGDLQVNLKRVHAQIEQASADRDLARTRATRNREYQVEVRKAQAQIDRLDADRQLLETQVDKATLRAEQAGVVLAGDWMERINTRVRLGDALFEVAPLDNLRVRALVSERDVDQVAKGSTGQFATTSQPRVKYNFEVAHIVPVGEAHGGSNLFEVRCEFDATPWSDAAHYVHGDVVVVDSVRYVALMETGADAPPGPVRPGDVNADPTESNWMRADGLRPGMGGVVMIEAGDRPVIWVATHKLIDFVRLKLWL